MSSMDLERCASRLESLDAQIKELYQERNRTVNELVRTVKRVRRDLQQPFPETLSSRDRAFAD